MQSLFGDELAGTCHEKSVPAKLCMWHVRPEAWLLTTFLAGLRELSARHAHRARPARDPCSPVSLFYIDLCCVCPRFQEATPSPATARALCEMTLPAPSRSRTWIPAASGATGTAMICRVMPCPALSRLRPLRLLHAALALAWVVAGMGRTVLEHRCRCRVNLYC